VSEGPPDSVERRFLAWSRRVRRRAGPILVAAPVVVGLLAFYAVRHLSVSTDTSSLVSEHLPYRQVYNEYRRVVPEGDELVVLVEGRTPGLADRATRRLVEALSGQDDVFESVYAPGLGPFFERTALLYLPLDSVETLVERVEAAAPLLRTLDADPTLAGLSAALDEALAADPAGRSASDRDLAPVLALLTGGAYAASEGRLDPVPWEALVLGRMPGPGDLRRTVTIRPRLTFENAVPGRASMERVRQAVRDLGLVERNGVTVRLTGSVAIEAEELVSAVGAVRSSGLLALASVAVILFVALRSFRLIAASLVTLVAGLLATAACAAGAVGSLNLISVAFAVLYIGLGIDYAIHLILRYRTLRAGGAASDEAVDGAVAGVGPSLGLSALTTAACFFAFIPTDFTGVSELGIIGGAGMFISLVATLTLLPAILSVVPPLRIGGGTAAGGLPELGAAIRAARVPIVAVAAIATVGALFLLPRARFDHNPLNLRDPESESVVAYRSLLADPVAKPLSVSVLREDTAGIRAVAERVAGSPVVDGIRSLLDFVPTDQAAKIEALRRLAAVLPDGRPASPAGGGASGGARPGGTPSAGGVSPGDPEAALARIRTSLNALRWVGSPDERMRARQLFHVLGAWERRLAAWPEADRAAHYAALEAQLVGTLDEQIARLRSAAHAEPVSLASLPAELRERWMSTDGRYRVEILPTEPLIETAELARYVSGVRELVPDATGSAVSELETGRVAASAFRRALTLAGVVTVVLLAVLLRNVRAVALVVGPLLAAAAWTTALTVLLDLPFNFANVIALPLLLGVGVDNGIHMVHQAGIGRGGGSDPMRASTSRAILHASLTTMASFGNLAFADHVGMASMGTLLTIGMTCVLVATLVVLPALLPPTSEADQPGP